MKKLLALAVLGSIVAVVGACDGGGNGSVGGTTSATTLPQLMAKLFDGSTDNGLPLDINAIDIDTASEAPTQFDMLLM